MKIEKVYNSMKARYQKEQEEDAMKRAEEVAKAERLKEEVKKQLSVMIPAVIDATKTAVEAIPEDTFYPVYKEIKLGCKSRKKESVELQCSSENNSMYFKLFYNGKESKEPSDYSMPFDRSVYTQLGKLIDEAYEGLIFGSYMDKVRLSFSESTITMEFFRSRCANQEDLDTYMERTNKNAKRFVADIKEIFPDAKTCLHAEVLNVTFKLN